MVWETDLPRLQSLNHYWADNPPLHKMVAAYLGIEPSTRSDQAGSVEEAAEFIPVATVTKDEFDDLLKQHGLPTGK